MPLFQKKAVTARGGGQQTYTRYAQFSTDEALQALETSAKGLSEKEARLREERHGSNALKIQRVGWWRILGRQFRSPFIYLLVAAAVLAMLLGEMIDGVMIFAFVLINASLGFFQEFRSEQALKLLKKFTSIHTQVLRDGREQPAAVESLVPGDIVRLEPGDIVPADLRLLEVFSLMIDESVLSGEAEPVEKSKAQIDKPKLPIHEARNIAFSATQVVSGSGVGVVVATGITAYIGTIAKLTVETQRVSSFEKGMSRFSSFVLRLVGVTLTIVFLANLLIKGPEANIGDLVIFSIALATAVIPEALPLVITFSLSRGALRLAKHKVVVKRLSAIEDLGGVEVLCTDKTGTITENQLTVVETYGPDTELLLFQAQAAAGTKGRQQDPFDVALTEAYRKSAKNGKFHYQTLSELPFDPNRRRNSVVVKTKDDRALLVVRGAAEAITPFLADKLSASAKTWFGKQGKQGRRVICIAHKDLKRGEEHSKSAEESGLVLSGAISFSDPLKPSTEAAIHKAKQLGVAVKIVTGDSPDVAGSVAVEIGLTQSRSDVITAEEFFALPHAKQREAAEQFNVFARFSPHHKYQLLDILQQHHEVGFLGEGINDAPALKIANVALVVQSASDISREAADVILLHRSLNVIMDGIQEGREVFANTLKYVKMTLASNFGNFYAVAIASLLINYLPMLPVQILLVNLLSDFPLTAVATDSVDPEEIKMPESYNLKDVALIATILGFVSTVFDFIIFGLFYRISPAVLQTNWFIGSILTELVLLYSLRTRKLFFKAKLPSLAILVLTILAGGATLLVPFTAFGASVFQFVRPNGAHLLIIAALVVLYFVATETVKLAYYRILEKKA
jgi:Mg2+-importing ATPase